MRFSVRTATYGVAARPIFAALTRTIARIRKKTKAMNLAKASERD